MAVERRDVLKMLAAAPVMGLFGGKAGVAHPADAIRFMGESHNSNQKIMWRVFEDPFLPMIAFPLGGIGTGTVSVGGRGELRDWEIHNHAQKNRLLPNTFFALWYRDEKGTGRARILEGKLSPPFPGGFGLPRDNMPGMPRFARARFEGAYPFARVALSDDNCPLTATLEAFNPMIPLDDRNSGLPAAIFYWRITNTGRHATPVTLACSLFNMTGNHSHGKNLNEFTDDGAFRGIRMSTSKHEPTHPHFGTMALVSPHKETTHLTRWARSGWFDDQSLFWNDFSEDGRLDRTFEEGPSPDNQSDTATLGLMDTLAPGESKVFPFVMTWHFPNRENRWNGEKEVKGKVLRNWYATQFVDAWDVAHHTVKNLRALESRTRQFQNILLRSTLPSPVLDAVSSQMSTMRTNVCFRTEEGNFYGFEGNSDDNGCCPLNCSHVWNYEQAVAHLYPQLERTMREVDFNHNVRPEGNMCFRTLIPLGDYFWAENLPAADGQMGTVVKLYREWKMSGDTEFLQRLWPNAKLALEYAWKRWDKDKDGVMEDIQHNTYDIEFHGPNPFMGAIYLAALRAGEEMARAMGEEDTARGYRALYEAGRAKLDATLWKGEYYVHKFQGEKDINATKYQLGEGCLSDMLLGQWMAHVNGLGYVLPQERVRTAMHSIYKYNFKPVMAEHYNPQRIYALGDEAGLLLASWPHGGRPELPFVYSDEVWTGIEYHVAAHLIYEGLIEEGLKIVEGCRNRYDGQRRNPWNEIECGHHYARAMSSWSLLLALSGYHYDGVAKRMEFHPVIHQNSFRSFWSCGSGWGEYRQTIGAGRISVHLDVTEGSLSLAQFGLPNPGGAKAGAVRRLHASVNNQSVAASVVMGQNASSVSFTSEIMIPAGGNLVIHIEA